MADYYTVVKDKKKTFPNPKTIEQYDQSIGPVKPTTEERLKGMYNKVATNPYVAGAVSAVKTRSAEIAHEMRGPNRGITSTGVGMGFGADPFGFNRPFREPMQAPERQPTRRRRKHRSAPREPADTFSDPFHIPRSMRHLF